MNLMAILNFSKILKLGSSHLIRARLDVEDNSISESLDRYEFISIITIKTSPEHKSLGPLAIEHF